MALGIQIAGNYDDQRLATLTRDLLKELRAADPSAYLPVSSVQDVTSKGDPITIGAIVLAFISGGALKTAIQCLTDFATVNRKVSIQLKNQLGETMTFSAEQISNKDYKTIEAQVEQFLSKNNEKQ